MSIAPSTIGNLLADCDAQGIRLLPTDAGGLTIDAPQDALAPALLCRIKTHKTKLLEALQRTPEAPMVDDDETVEPPELGTNGWPLDCIDPDELTPCPKCKTLELWQSLLGNWRCQRCDPPKSTRKAKNGPDVAPP